MKGMEDFRVIFVLAESHVLSSFFVGIFLHIFEAEDRKSPESRRALAFSILAV